LIKSNQRNRQRPKRIHAPVTNNIYTCTSTRNVFLKLYYTSNKVLDISIVIWKGKAIVIFQNCHTDLG
jgi:hypothetical protein